MTTQPTLPKHRKWLSRSYTALLLTGLLTLLPAAHAIIVLRDPGRNLTAPTGEWANSGWQWEGDWHRFPGTVIGPHHFITAAHTGGLPLQPFRFRGKDYYALEKTRIPSTDLAVWRITGTFPDWAPLYEGDAEQGQTIMVYGRGGPRGTPVVIQGQQRGYWWSDADGRLSWGRNRVADVVTNPNPQNIYGELLTFFFNPDTSGAGLDTGAVSGGDSGGGVFLRVNGEGPWKLAGVIYGVDRAYSPTLNSPISDFATALYDARGMYRSFPSGRVYLDPRSPDKSPTTCLASRVSPYSPQIRALLRQPPRWPYYAVGVLGVLGLIGLIATVSLRRFNRKQSVPDTPSVPAV